MRSRLLAFSCVAAAASVAEAQTAAPPAAPADACQVTIVRAPDEVRTEIEDWVHAEPRCVATLEVRVIVTDEGLYLLARRPDGRLHERTVPDAQTAGVLVASWAAEDQPAPVLAPPGLPDAPAPAPAVTASAGAPATTARAARAPWIAFGGTVRAGGRGGYGLRGEVDVITRGAWTVGAALSVAKNEDAARAATRPASMSSVDYRVLAQLTRSWVFRDVEIRLGAGVGLLHANLLVTFDDGYGYPMAPVEGSANAATVEAAASVTLPVGKDWALTAGPTMSYVSVTAEGPTQDVTRQDVTLAVFGGLRYAR